MLALLMVLLMLPCTAYAAGSIDLNRNVKLTLSYLDESTPLAGAEFQIYLVATVDETGELSVTEAFKQFNVDIRGKNDAAWKDLASTLEGYILRDNIAASDNGKTNQDGNLIFPTGDNKLTQGLYLVLGEKHTQGNYYYEASPFMVMLPTQDMENNEWLYEMTVNPKYDADKIPDTPSTVTRKVLKVWDDEGVENLRPQEVVVQLLRSGDVYDTVTLNEENNWRYTWAELDDSYTWTVAEKELENYTVTITREGVTFLVTNTYSPKEPDDNTAMRTVLKVWDDRGYEWRRPRSVGITLLMNGAAYDTQILNEANGWQYTWVKLPKCDKNGTEYIWTIQEAPVSGYVSSIRQDGFTFILTNALNRQKLPQTGALWWLVPLLAAVGLAFLIVGILSRKKKDHE